jgi:uncharacterized membrane protein YjjB (DUF3815 family)
VTLLGALVLLVSQDAFSFTAEMDQNERTITAALFVGVIGRLLAKRSEQPPAIWLVPAILPLLPAPATLVPLLAATEKARASLQAQALTTAFLIGVGVASGDILVAIYQRRRMRHNR